MSAGLPSDVGVKLNITATAQARNAITGIMIPSYTSSDISNKLIGIGIPDAFNFSENLGTMPVA